MSRTIAAILRKANRRASYESAALSVPPGVTINGKTPTQDEWTALVKENTRVYRDSWVHPAILDVVAWLEGERDTRAIDYHDRADATVYRWRVTPGTGSAVLVDAIDEDGAKHKASLIFRREGRQSWIKSAEQLMVLR